MQNLYCYPMHPGTDPDGIEFCAFAGAGVLGISYAGALQALDEEGIRPKIKYYAGSSAGALIALLAAANASGQYCRTLLETDVSSFLDYGGETPVDGLDRCLAWAHGATELFLSLGQARGDVLFDWIGDCLEQLGFSCNITFSELYNQTGNHCCITATSVTTSETLYFSRSSYPDMVVREAVRASMIIPFIFQPVQLDNHLLVDGGMLDNYPLNVFDLLSPHGGLTGVNRKAIGFIPLHHGSWTSGYNQVNDLVKFSSSLVNGIHNRLHVLQSNQPYFWERTIAIETGDVFSRDFDLTREQKLSLYEAGYQATKDYLEKRRAVMKVHGPLPDNLFIPVTYTASTETNATPKLLTNEELENTLVYQTNPDAFAFKNFY